MKISIYLSLFLISILVSAASCKKNSNTIIEPINSIDSIASYKIIITGTWAAPHHTIPTSEHFTQFIGLIHGDACSVYHVGSQASKGVEDVAERGNSIELKKEMDLYIAANKALSKFYITIPGIVGKDSGIINVNTKNAYISFESMIAPSPDWFVGLDSYNLIQKGKWVDEVTLPLYGYDAGTEDGDVFGYNNPPTSPQQPIQYMTPSNASVIANGNAIIAPFATVRFVKM